MTEPTASSKMLQTQVGDFHDTVGFKLGEHMKPKHSEHSELSVQSEQMDAGARLDRAKHKRTDFQNCHSGAFQHIIKTNNQKPVCNSWARWPTKTCLQPVGAVARRFFRPVTRRSRVVVAARYRCCRSQLRDNTQVTVSSHRLR